MMGYTYGFEKMAVWQMSRKITLLVYQTTRAFPKEEMFGITSQIRRADISIGRNLAEGSARVGSKDQSRFYSMAFSSAVEVVNLLIISHDLMYLSDEDLSALRQELEKLTYQINQLVARLSTLQEPDADYAPPLNPL